MPCPPCCREGKEIQRSSNVCCYSDAAPQSWSLGYSPQSCAGCVEVKNLVVNGNVDPSRVKCSRGGYCMDDERKYFASLKNAIGAYSKRRRIFLCQRILKEVSVNESFEERLVDEGVDEGDLSNSGSEVDLGF